MNKAVIVTLSLFLPSLGTAGFSVSEVKVHPAYPVDEPYVLELVLPRDVFCEDTPLVPKIVEFTGDGIVVRIVEPAYERECVETDPRILVDVSSVFEEEHNGFSELNVTVLHNEYEYHEVVTLNCGGEPCIDLADDPNPNRHRNPDTNLYDKVGYESQGILLSRQNDRMGVYFLTYDENGNNQWLIGAGGMRENVYFGDLYHFNGGACLGCPDPEISPEMEPAGTVALVALLEGEVYVKVNDGPFELYRPLLFGHKDRRGCGNADGNSTNGEFQVPDLSGRWAFSEGRLPLVKDEEGTVLFGENAPRIFDVRFQKLDDCAPVLGVGRYPHTHVTYSLHKTGGAEFGLMWCHTGDTRMWCDVVYKDQPPTQPGLVMELLTVNRMQVVEYVYPDSEAVPETGVAVRVD